MLGIDHFGNIRTTIRSTDLEHLTYLKHLAGLQRCQVQVQVNEQLVLQSISTTYAEAEPGEFIALIDSAGYLEIAVNRGSAAELIRCCCGDPVQVDCRSEELRPAGRNIEI
ncbi:MAG: hypothetical protein Q3M30_16705 [Candidatus Electrothrix sp. Rat3]|nr:hypothetical protein [Candidatus Electrothrix rattekaaiensis]